MKTSVHLLDTEQSENNPVNDLITTPNYKILVSWTLQTDLWKDSCWQDTTPVKHSTRHTIKCRFSSEAAIISKVVNTSKVSKFSSWLFGISSQQWGTVKIKLTGWLISHSHIFRENCIKTKGSIQNHGGYMMAVTAQETRESEFRGTLQYTGKP